jgi:Family of unknown function (DUF5985)
MMASFIYGMCAVAALICAVLLLQSYRREGYRLLYWSGICFLGLSANNLLVLFDKTIYPEFDLSLVRSATALFAMVVLLYGLIWDQG